MKYFKILKNGAKDGGWDGGRGRKPKETFIPKGMKRKEILLQQHSEALSSQVPEAFLACIPILTGGS